MIKVGLTGNIGSGKSMVARTFEILGVPVFHADEIAKNFLKDEKILLAIRKKFGSTIFTNEMLDRKKLASVVFSDLEALAFLNSLIHPRVRQQLNVWFDKQGDHQYAIQEAAIIFESGFYHEFDKIIIVAAPVELCLQRVMIRDGIEKSEVEKRLMNQWQQEKKIEFSHYVIKNDEKQLVIPQVLKIHEELSKNKKAAR